MKRFIIGVVAFSFVTVAEAGPLGLEFGSSLASMANLKLKKEKPYMYSASSLPKGHPDFDDYRLVISPKLGLCKYSAYISNVSTNTYGDSLKQKYNSLLEALTAKYGTPRSFDFLQKGSIWNEPRDFMTGLKKEERALASYWTSEKLSLPDDIGVISLKAMAVTDNSGMISVTYSGTNESDCIDSINEQRNSNL